MRHLPLLSLVLVACGGSEPIQTEGSLGFEFAGALGFVCPPDMQGQFMKVFVEGTEDASACDMDLPRPIPLTCEDRRAYLESVPPICLGAPAAAGANLPMLDYLLVEEEGQWADFDYVPITYCHEGSERTLDLFGNTEVSWLDESTMQLSFDLESETGAETVSGSVPVEMCPPL
jgi:hypothetical protein